MNEMETHHNDRNGYVGDTYQSTTIRPVRKRLFTKPKHEKSLMLGAEGRHFGKIRAWTHGATIEYDDFASFISLKGGTGTAFLQITLEDLDSLTKFIQAVKAELVELYPKLEKEKQALHQAKRNFDAEVESHKPGKTIPQVPEASTLLPGTEPFRDPKVVKKESNVIDITQEVYDACMKDVSPETRDKIEGKAKKD